MSEFEVAPCGECVVGQCDDCDQCVWFREKFPRPAGERVRVEGRNWTHFPPEPVDFEP